MTQFNYFFSSVYSKLSDIESQSLFEAGTHQATFKELAATNGESHSAPAWDELIEYQQLSIVYIHHSKGETETKIYDINADLWDVNKATIAYQFEYQLCW